MDISYQATLSEFTVAHEQDSLARVAAIVNQSAEATSK